MCNVIIEREWGFFVVVGDGGAGGNQLGGQGLDYRLTIHGHILHPATCGSPGYGADVRYRMREVLTAWVDLIDHPPSYTTVQSSLSEVPCWNMRVTV